MRRICTTLALMLLHGCAAFGVHTASNEAEATLLATHTLHDYEIARTASASELARLEGSFQLDPADEDLMILLGDAWLTHTELFLVDAYERARVEGPPGDADYQRQRVETGFARARHWGLAWLKARVPDLDTATLSAATLSAALEEEFDDAEDATALLVLGQAFLGAVGDRPPPADLATSKAKGAKSVIESGSSGPDLGALFLQRSLTLDETTRLGTAHALLGAYYAGLGEDSQKATAHFRRAALVGGGKYLLTELRMAISLHCPAGDRSAFERSLNEVLKAGDPVPEVRLDNAVAKRRASRWLLEARLTGDCKF